MPVEAANALAPVEPLAAIVNPSNSGEFNLICSICIGQSGKLLIRSSSSSNEVRSILYVSQSVHIDDYMRGFSSIIRFLLFETKLVNYKSVK